LNSLNLNGLDVAALYDWKVRAICSSDTSGYSFAQFNTATPVCNVPLNNTVSFGTNNSIVLGWSPVVGATGYIVQVKLQQNSWENLLRDTVITGTSVTFAPFKSGLNLSWRVRSVCAANWSLYQSSQCTTPCPSPANLTAGSVTASSALLTWTASGANTNFGRDVYYKIASSATWIKIGSNIGTNAFQLTGLAAGRMYDAKVVQRCESTFSIEIQTQFTTPCSVVPAGVQASEITTNRARLTWNAVPGAVSYTLQYKKSSVTTWTTVTGITSAQYMLSALTANTPYQVQVRTVCASGSSAFSNTVSFSTYCLSAGSNGSEWIDLFSLGSINRVSGRESGGYLQTGLTSNLVIGSAANYGQISAGFSKTVKAQLFAVYIDLNRNGSYSDAGEQVVSTLTLSNAGTYNFSVNIPSTASPGLTGMRVVLLQKANGVVMGPCVTGKRGETEDYYINLIAGSAVDDQHQYTAVQRTDSEAAVKAVNPSAAIRVFPNPSVDLFHIEIPAGLEYQQYDVVTVHGKSIQNGTLSDMSTLKLNLTAQPAGLYFVRLRESSGNLKVLKLIKQ
jgi:hypothetical protein